MADSNKERNRARAAEVRRIAQEAIQNITHLSNLIGNQENACDRNNPQQRSRGFPASSSSGSGSHRYRPHARENAVSELRRRFPSTGSAGSSAGGGGRFTSTFSRNRGRGRGGGAGRPFASGTVTRDIVILRAGEYTVPSRNEKAQMERNGCIVTGMDIDRGWNEETLMLELRSVIPNDFKDVPFQIMKNCHGSIIPPNIPNGRKIDSALLLRSIAPTGSIYIQLLDDPIPDNILDIPAFEQSIPNEEVKTEDIGDIGSPIDLTGDEEINVPVAFIKPILDDAPADLIDPVEILKYLQLYIVTGRPLKVDSLDAIPEGETNYKTVNRDNILASTFEELPYVLDPRNTFQVDFMGEDCADLGGPRKEWIRLVLKEIKAKYFDLGLRALMSKEYYYVGQIFGIAMLQNGQMPSFLSEALIEDLMSAKSNDVCIKQMQWGMETLGMHSALIKFPQLLYLPRPGGQNRGLNVQKPLQLVKPVFSEEGSNSLKFEKEVYQVFIKYIREVAANRRASGNVKITLNHILQFITGASEEPVLGFVQNPQCKFVLPKEDKIEDPNAASQGSGEKVHN